ncbi:MAG: transketolase C-terminal domain-containing protein, partial [Oscillospiraceae bacterium]
GIQTLKTSLRRSVYHSTFFEEMGFQYIGPVDGHNLPALCHLFLSLKNIDKPLFIHLETTKGKGFKPAENNPGAFHGVSSFDANHITDPDITPGASFSTEFGKALAKYAGTNPRICAITAAMKYGTGLQYFKKAYRERFFDVGMAEEHAVTFAAGLAKNGMLPVVAIYSTFLQRSYDQIIHDVTLQKLNVLFAIDRAGFVPGDGETHQGIYDAAFLSQHSQMPIVSPANYAELDFWLGRLLKEYTGPRAIRYPRGEEAGLMAQKGCSGNLFDRLLENKGAKVALVSYGRETEDALQAAGLLQKQGIKADVYQMVHINPIPPGLPQALAGFSAVVFAEESVRQGGIGEHLAMQLYAAGFKGGFVHIGAPGAGNDHASVPQLKEAAGLDAQGIARRTENHCKENRL